MKLCARFYDPQQGRVLFDGVPMKDIEPESLMSRISMVFQDVYLFQDTIRDNIRFGKPGATDERSSRQRESLLPRFHHAPAAGIRHDGG